MKTLRCRDVGFDCDKEIRAEREEDVMQQAAEHVKTDHGVDVTPEIATQARAQIRTE